MNFKGQDLRRWSSSAPRVLVRRWLIAMVTALRPTSMNASNSVEHKFEIFSLSGPLRQLWIPSAIDVREVGKAVLAWRYELSKAEVETLELIAQGLTNDELASALNLQELKSVKNRVKGILNKLGIRNRTRAAVIAAQFGFGAHPLLATAPAERFDSLPQVPASTTSKKPLASMRLRASARDEQQRQRSTNRE
jgi:DNA-binding CsgD family transcriptional regulator